MSCQGFLCQKQFYCAHCIFIPFNYIPIPALYTAMIRLTKQFRSTFTAWLGPFLLVVVRDADDMKAILASEECFDKVNFFYDLFDFECGLLVLNGKTYKQHRRNTIPVFHPAQLKKFLPIAREKMNNFLKRFDGRLEPLKEIDFGHLATDYALETTLATMFSNNSFTENERIKMITATET